MTDDISTNTLPGIQASPPTLEVDYDLYAHHLEDCDWSDDQKREFLDALWSVIVEFVALGFEVHPVQQAKDACGKLPESPAEPPISGQSAVQSKGQFITAEFVNATDGAASSEAERIQE